MEFNIKLDNESKKILSSFKKISLNSPSSVEREKIDVYKGSQYEKPKEQKSGKIGSLIGALKNKLSNSPFSKNPKKKKKKKKKKSMTSFISSFIGGFLGAIVGLMSSLLEMFKPVALFVKAILFPIMKPFMILSMLALQRLYTYLGKLNLGKIFPNLRKTLNGSNEGDTDVDKKNLFTDLAVLGGTAGGLIAGPIGVAIGVLMGLVIAELVIELTDWIKDKMIPTLKDWWSNTGEWFKKITKKVKDWCGGAIEDTGEWFGKIGEKVKEWCGGAIEDTGNWFKKIGLKVKEWCGGAIEDTGGWFGKIGTKIKEIYDNVVLKIFDFFEKIKNIFKKIVKVVDGILDKIGFKKARKKVIKTVSNAGKSIGNAGKSIGGFFKNIFGGGGKEKIGGGKEKIVSDFVINPAGQISNFGFGSIKPNKNDYIIGTPNPGNLSNNKNNSSPNEIVMNITGVIDERMVEMITKKISGILRLGGGY